MQYSTSKALLLLLSVGALSGALISTTQITAGIAHCGTAGRVCPSFVVVVVVVVTLT